MHNPIDRLEIWWDPKVNFCTGQFCRDATLLRVLVKPQESNLHALHILVTAPIVILGRLCMQKIIDPDSYGLTVCII